MSIKFSAHIVCPYCNAVQIGGLLIENPDEQDGKQYCPFQLENCKNASCDKTFAAQLVIEAESQILSCRTVITQTITSYRLETVSPEEKSRVEKSDS